MTHEYKGNESYSEERPVPRKILMEYNAVVNSLKSMPYVTTHNPEVAEYFKEAGYIVVGYGHVEDGEVVLAKWRIRS